MHPQQRLWLIVGLMLIILGVVSSFFLEGERASFYTRGTAAEKSGFLESDDTAASGPEQGTPSQERVRDNESIGYFQ